MPKSRVSSKRKRKMKPAMVDPGKGSRKEDEATPASENEGETTDDKQKHTDDDPESMDTLALMIIIIMN